MLTKLKIKGFKSLRGVEVAFPRLTVLFGPNAAGKSNLLDAVQALSRVGTERTLADALAEPIRGHPIEFFAFPSGGLTELLSRKSAAFSLEAALTSGKESYIYRIGVQIEPGSGKFSTADEYLALLTAKGEVKGNPAIEPKEGQLYIRRKSKPAHPRQEVLGANHSILSDPRLSGPEYRWLVQVRDELSGWRTYYLDPRVAMRSAQPPSDVADIGVLGGDIAPFLYKLRAEKPKHMAAVQRTLRSIIPSVEDVAVDMDKRRGTLDLLIRQGGVDYSSRIVSEGTLRVLALCTIAVNPWGRTLLAFEEPENGVHPRRLELIAEMLMSLALDQGRQVVVTTHSPLFCDAVLKRARGEPDKIGMFNVRRDGPDTVVQPFDITGPLFADHEVSAALTAGTEDGLFESLLLRGMLDE